MYSESIRALSCAGVVVVTLLALSSPPSLSSARPHFLVSFPSVDLPSHCHHVRSLQYPLFNLPPRRRRLTVHVAWTSLSSTPSPTPPPLPHVVIKSPLSTCAHCRCHRGTSTCSSHRHSYVSSSHCQHCLRLLVTVACTFSGNYFLVLFPSCCCSCVHVGGHG